MTPDHRFVRALIKKHGIQKGDFTLASGERSDLYIDMRKVVMHSFTGAAIGRLLYDHLKDLPIAAVGGPAMAAIPLISVVLHQYFFQSRPLEGFWVRSEVKEHGLKHEIEGCFPNTKKEAPKVALLDDVVTSGCSLHAVAKVVSSKGAIIEKVVCVVERNPEARSLFESMGISYTSLFTLEDILHP